MEQIQTSQNPLGHKSIPSLLTTFAIPSIIATLVSSLYNIVDQIFIGQGVGYLGNAATNVSYPLTTICLALSLLIGIGSASRFSLSLGAGEEEKACRVVGNGVCMMILFGLVYAVLIELFLYPMLNAFGATAENLPYCRLLFPHYCPWYAFPDHHYRYEQPDSCRRQSQVFHDLYADRRHPQHHPGSHFYFRVPAWRCRRCLGNHHRTVLLFPGSHPLPPEIPECPAPQGTFPAAPERLYRHGHSRHEQQSESGSYHSGPGGHE